MAVLIGYMAYRRPPSTVGLLWLCALALSLRCFFESVMVVFYLGPPLALIVLAAATCASWKRLVGASAIAVVATVFCFHRASEWGYWTPMVAFLVIGLACAWPGRAEVGISGAAPQIGASEMSPAPATDLRASNVLSIAARGRSTNQGIVLIGALFIARRRGPNKAAIAVVQSILNVVWHFLTTGTYYDDPVPTTSCGASPRPSKPRGFRSGSRLSA